MNKDKKYHAGGGETKYRKVVDVLMGAKVKSMDGVFLGLKARMDDRVVLEPATLESDQVLQQLRAQVF